MPENTESMLESTEPIRQFDGHVVQRRYDGRRVPLMVVGICCAVLAVTFLSGFTYVLFLQPSHATSGLFAFQDAVGDVSDHRADVSLPIYLPDLDTRSSRIPVKITGVLANGSAFDKDTYVSRDGKGLRLEPGTYELHVTGSPISSSGVMYSIPGNGINIVIGDDLVVSIDPPDFMSFGVISAIDITEEQIAAACEFIKNDPERTQYADTLAEQVRDRRSEAIRAAEAASAARTETARVVAEQGYKVPEVQQISEPDWQDTSDYNTDANTDTGGESSSANNSGGGSSNNNTSSSGNNSGYSNYDTGSNNYGQSTSGDNSGYSDYSGTGDTGYSGNSGSSSPSYSEPDIAPVDTGGSGGGSTGTEDSGYSPSDTGYSGGSSSGSGDSGYGGGEPIFDVSGGIVDADSTAVDTATGDSASNETSADVSE